MPGRRGPRSRWSWPATPRTGEAAWSRCRWPTARPTRSTSCPALEGGPSLAAIGPSRRLRRRPVALAVAASDHRRGLGVADDRLGPRVEVEDPADPGPDVGQVDQGGRAVAGRDVGVGPLRGAPDAVEEVLMVGREVGRAGAFGELLVPGPVESPADR